ncbi:MAG: signal peptidase I, partial [Alphaproteobacteria bacterium]|nr:signal peptidase I [Alphaproteobacteria bacterium]
FIAKPFYIPSESMLPGLEVGDQIVVTKFPYGWSFVSPTIPNPINILKTPFLSPEDAADNSWFVQLPHMDGRLFGHLPERGDVVVLSPPGRNVDYIKRLIGLPGDRIELRNGIPIINGVPVRHDPQPDLLLPVDENTKCLGDYNNYPGALTQGKDGKMYCRLPIVRETLPNGRYYNIIQFNDRPSVDNYPPVTVGPNQVFVMGDNRDRSADSRVPEFEEGLGGPIGWEQLGGRAEFITYSLNGSQRWYNPLSWIGALRSGRAGTSLRPARTPN